MLPSIYMEDGFVSTAAKVHLQEFWIILLHWSKAIDEQTPFCRLRNGIFDADRAFCQLWNGAFDDHMAFCWPWNGVLGASAGFASPGTTFWAPWTAQNEKNSLGFFDDASAGQEIYG